MFVSLWWKYNKNNINNIVCDRRRYINVFSLTVWWNIRYLSISLAGTNMTVTSPVILTLSAFSTTWTETTRRIHYTIKAGPQKNCRGGQSLSSYSHTFPPLIFGRSYSCTHYDRLLVDNVVCQSVCQSVTLCIVAKQYILRQKCLNT